MRNRELRAGWARGDGEKAESGWGWGGAYSLAMGWDMRMLGARKEESRPHHPPYTSFTAVLSSETTAATVY